MKKYKIGIIGGSGFYTLNNFKLLSLNKDKLFKDTKMTKYTTKNLELYFIPRHGKKHLILPHQIDYFSNIEKFKKLNVDFIISFCTAGSLDKKIKPGSYVIPENLIDFTNQRIGSNFVLNNNHINIEPIFNSNLLKICKKSIKQSNIIFLNKKITLGIINGPRFATIAEQKMYKKLNCNILNMTQMPEIYIAHVFQIPTISLCHVTDTTEIVDKTFNIYSCSAIKIFKSNEKKIENILFNFFKLLKKEKICFKKIQKKSFV